MVGPNRCDVILMTVAVGADMQRRKSEGTSGLHTEEKVYFRLTPEETLLTLPLWLQSFRGETAQVYGWAAPVLVIFCAV